jgi:hypothetical protein
MNHLKADLLKYAKEDMQMAREAGSICIIDTKAGNIELCYDSLSQTYSIHKMPTTETIAYGKEKTIGRCIASLYTVVGDN